MILPFCQTHSFQLNTARFWRFCFGDQQNGLGHAGGPPPATRGSPEAPPPLPAGFLPPPPHPWRRRAQALGQTAIGGAATAWPSVASPPSGTEQGGQALLSLAPDAATSYRDPGGGHGCRAGPTGTEAPGRRYGHWHCRWAAGGQPLLTA